MCMSNGENNTYPSLKVAFWAISLNFFLIIESFSKVLENIFVWQVCCGFNINKTWSLVSNSSLSKTFALGSFESLKFKSSVLSLQRSLILGQKKCWVWKKFVSEKIMVPRKILGLKTWKFFWPINVLDRKNFEKKNFRSKNSFCSKKILGPKKFWVPKKS